MKSITVRKTKINKSREYKKRNFPSACSFRMKSTLPVLVKLQRLNEIHPKEVLDLLAHLVSSESVTLLDSVEKPILISYLEKWGYDTSWIPSN